MFFRVTTSLLLYIPCIILYVRLSAFALPVALNVPERACSPDKRITLSRQLEQDRAHDTPSAKKATNFDTGS